MPLARKAISGSICTSTFCGSAKFIATRQRRLAFEELLLRAVTGRSLYQAITAVASVAGRNVAAVVTPIVAIRGSEYPDDGAVYVPSLISERPACAPGARRDDGIVDRRVISSGPRHIMCSAQLRPGCHSDDERQRLRQQNMLTGRKPAAPGTVR